MAAPAQETERAAFLLTHMARLVGAWHVALPGFALAARQAAASFIGYAALPSVDEGFTVHCPPVSPAEKARRPACCPMSP